jgi:hypothetical protein
MGRQGVGLSSGRQRKQVEKLELAPRLATEEHVVGYEETRRRWYDCGAGLSAADHPLFLPNSAGRRPSSSLSCIRLGGY